MKNYPVKKSCFLPTLSVLALSSVTFAGHVYARDSALISQGAAPSAGYSGATPVKKSPPPAVVLDKDSGQHPEDNDMLLEDMWGLRPWFASKGITFTLVDVNEVWGNPSGGLKKGAAYEGMTTMTLNYDPEKTLGIKNGLFNISALQIRGRAHSAENLGVLNPVSNAEADRATRLWELWYQQGFFDNKFDIRIGKLSLDQEFNITDYGVLFLNSSFGWPMIPSLNTYSGGVAYPLAAPAIRFRFQPDEHWTNLFAIADDNPNNSPFCNPSGPLTCDPQEHHRSGTRFNFKTGAFITEELQYHLNPQPDDASTAKDDVGLPGTYRIGAYYDSAKFPDQRYNYQGGLLGDPNSEQKARMRRNNWSVYGIVDQMVWRPSAQSSESLGVFGRVQVTPNDRNPINFAADAGLVYKGLFGRDKDSFGIGWGLGRMGERARAYDRDYRRLSDENWRVRGTEHHLEVTWQVQATPWLQLQPNFQYMFKPGAGVVIDGTHNRIADEAVFGLRTTANF